ncbi:unnamed protein product [Schistosoma mansoni]|uniref:Smp_205830 n=1 Tax=Schistosoma mansoni TaxID=6183 RepID=UPI00022C8687|nr:unnamed protein product [Schistosoma mansoni]|eukprot:XP_018644780.1 unnamed protein product [Schistosoma mansoni]
MIPTLMFIRKSSIRRRITSRLVMIMFILSIHSYVYLNAASSITDNHNSITAIDFLSP